METTKTYKIRENKERGTWEIFYGDALVGGGYQTEQDAQAWRGEFLAGLGEVR